MNREKFKALVQYICYRCSDPSYLGKTKLHKVLHYSDFAAYVRLNAPITGETYVKHQFGPIASHLDEILNELVVEEMMVVRDMPCGEYIRKECIALRQPSLAMFSAEEISLVDEMIDVICYQHSAKSISDESHTRVWEAAKVGEEIPYSTAFINRLRSISPDDMDWARQYIKRRAS